MTKRFNLRIYLRKTLEWGSLALKVELPLTVCLQTKQALEIGSRCLY